jgi:tetratricopeptide (TPR) repeat protein
MKRHADLARPVRVRCACRLASGRGLALRAGAAAIAIALAGSAVAAPPQPPTRETMRQVFDALSKLLPLAMSTQDWNGAAGSAEPRASIETLAQAADQLARHGEAQDVTFRFLSRSLAADARSIQRHYERKRYDNAAYFTERVAESCIACHSRLPVQGRPDFAGNLLARVDLQTLTPLARANLQTAGRQFDAALESYEAAFAASAASIGVLDLTDAISAYLVVALRVRRDPERVKRGLALLGRRSDLSGQLEQNLKTWNTALDELKDALIEEPSLERARAILAQGRALTEFALDAADRIHATVASSLLYRYLEEKRPQGQALAEALYLLAKTESFTQRAFEVSEAAHYLEQAIRAAPHSEVAERAFARLELETLLEYSDPSGVQLPEPLVELLAELRRLSRIKPRPGDKPANRDPHQAGGPGALRRWTGGSRGG